MPSYINTFRCSILRSILVIHVVLFLVSCDTNKDSGETDSGRTLRNNSSTNINADDDVAPPPPNCAILGRLNVLYLSETDFRALVGRRGNGDRKLAFQACVTSAAFGKLTLRGWAGRNKDSDFNTTASVPLLIGPESQINLAGVEFFLSTQKLYKQYVDDIMRELDDGASTTQIVAFSPFLHSTTKELAYKVKVFADVDSIQFPDTPGAPPPPEAQTNPSPPASFLDATFD